MFPVMAEVWTFVIPAFVRITKLPADPRGTGAGPRAAVTVTVYVAVVLSAAVTVYTTGLVKSFDVVPLVCATAPTLTPVPVVVNVATRAVTFVPFGMITDRVFADSFIVPATPASEYAVMALAELGATVTVTVYEM